MSWKDMATKGVPLNEQDLQGNKDLYYEKIPKGESEFFMRERLKTDPTPPPMNEYPKPKKESSDPGVKTDWKLEFVPDSRPAANGGRGLAQASDKYPGPLVATNGFDWMNSLFGDKQSSNSHPVDPNKFGLSGRPQSDNQPLSMSDWMDLQKQASINKDPRFAKSLPNLSKLASNSDAMWNPLAASESAYNETFRQGAKGTKLLRARTDPHNEMLARRKVAGVIAGQSIMRDAERKDTPLLPYLKELAGIDVPVVKGETPPGAAAQYDWSTRRITVGSDYDKYPAAILDTIPHELAHARVHRDLGDKAPDSPEGVAGLTTDHIDGMLSSGRARDLAYEYSGKHFANKYGVPTVDMATERLMKKIRALGRQNGYTPYPPEKDPRFEKSQNMTRIMRWLGSQNK